jgi:predicted ATPase
MGTENIESDLEELILEKTEGVPFFIEEFIKSVKDLMIIEKRGSTYYLAKDMQQVIIPSTIHDVIMARVDALPEIAKDLLQTGSVIEREFNYDLIQHVSELSEKELISQFSVLKDAELIFERGIYPDSTYIFKHALTQEVVYDSLLTRKKKELHNKIGQAIMQLYKDNLHEYYSVLAEHFINGENFENGAGYSKLAARKAEKAGSLNDAIAYADKQVICLERLPQTESIEEKIIDARTVLGLYLAQLAQQVEAKAAIDPIVELAIQRNYKRRISHINLILGLYKFQVEEDFPKAFDYWERALKTGEELNDSLILSFINLGMGVFLFHCCEFADSRNYLEKALEVNIEANSLWGLSTVKSHTAGHYFFRGDIGVAYEASTDSLRIASESGDIFSQAHAYTYHGMSCYGKGYLEEAKENLLKGVDFSEKLNQIFIASNANDWLGETYFALGEYEKAQTHYKKAISLYQDNHLYPSVINCYKIFAARAKFMNNVKDINLNEIFKYHENNKFKSLEGRMKNCIGEILLNLEDQHISEAENWTKKAIEADKRNGMMFHLARNFALYAEIFKRKGDLQNARENMKKAIETFKKSGADGWVEKYEKELEALS